MTAQTLAAGGIDAAALLAKLPLAANMEAELHRHIEKMYEYDPEALQALQQEPMELTSGTIIQLTLIISNPRGPDILV